MNIVTKINKDLRKISILTNILLFLTFSMLYFFFRDLSEIQYESLVLLLISFFGHWKLKTIEQKKLSEVLEIQKKRFEIYEEVKFKKEFKFILIGLLALSTFFLIYFRIIDNLTIDYFFLVIFINAYYYLFFISLNASKLLIYENVILRYGIIVEIIRWSEIRNVSMNYEYEQYLMVFLKNGRIFKITNDPYSMQGQNILDIKDFLTLKIDIDIKNTP